jgi:hypothetical protein
MEADEVIDARVKALEDAVRYLWERWADAEGEGQPEVAVFGDADMDAYLKAQGETVPERASPEVQAVIRELLSTPHPQ